jgi:paraquat-inducible protein B
MNKQDKSNTNHAKALEAVIRPKKSFSIVWIVPILALLIGGWLVYKAISEKGPVISIVFETAEGLEADKTKIKYKDVEIGKVTAIKLGKDLSNIVVTAELNKGAKPYLTDKSRFWVVRARLKAGEISGLGTLLGGAYIAIDPVFEGTPATAYIGLETPPIATTETEGSHFTLKSEKLGSFDVGSPVYYRQIEVGQVESYKLDDDGENVSIQIFIDSPHHKYVRKNTRFWDAGGFDVSVDAGGLRVDTQSIVSLMIGGLAFDNPKRLGNNDLAENDDIFKLYSSHEEAVKDEYTIRHEWLLVFKDSVRGLSKGAPVEFKGIRVGNVLEIDTTIEIDTGDIPISVLIETEPERFLSDISTYNESERKEFLDLLVAKGFRAQLKTGSLLTGQLFVNLDFHPDRADQKIDWEGRYPKLPTIQEPLEEALAIFQKMINRIEEIPFQQISEDIQLVIKNLNATIKQSETLLKQLNTKLTPEISATLEQAKKSLAAMEKIMSSDSPISQDAQQALEELAGAARSMRVLADYLEQHPEALIYGKGVNQ